MYFSTRSCGSLVNSVFIKKQYGLPRQSARRYSNSSSPMGRHWPPGFQSVSVPITSRFGASQQRLEGVPLAIISLFKP